MARQPEWRLVTIVGPGGIGKTTVALAVAEALAPSYPDGSVFVDLGLVSDSERVLSAFSAALGVAIRAEDGVSQLVAALGEKRMLIVLDSCEHLVNEAATLVETLLGQARGISFLATSREPLHTGGERVHRLPPLDVPPRSAALTAAEALSFSAVQLFVERAAASLGGLTLADADASVVAEICRRLDGIALAIELAAARAGEFSLREMVTRLDDRFRVLTRGRRTAMPRHQTLRATLDWSYNLLTAPERAVLRRLAIFPGGFELEAATAIMATTDGEVLDVAASLSDLVAKSLVTRDVSNVAVHCRLLDTTRAYALEKLAETGELEITARRHAEYYGHLFERAETEWETRPTDEWLANYGWQIDDLRAAVDWAFSPDGDTSIGVALTASAVPLWMHFSLLQECSRWTGQAIACLDSKGWGTRREMLLQAGLGFSTMATIGVADRARTALTRALELAETFNHAEYQLRALASLCIFQLRLGDFRGALALARRCEAVAKNMKDLAAVPTADRLLGASLCLLGKPGTARAHLQRALDRPTPVSQRGYAYRFGPDHRSNTLVSLATVLWLQGFPEQAQHASRLAIEQVPHPVSLCLALFVGAGFIARWVGDLATAERLGAELIAQTEKHSFGPYHTFGLALNGIFTARRGDPATGAKLLGDALDRLHKAKYYIYHAMFLTDLAEVLSSAGRIGEGLAVIGETLELIEQKGAFWYSPEALRIKGELFLLQGTPGAAAAAEGHFRQALDWARRQGALSWELRCATSLARLWHSQARNVEALELLASVYDRFTEGFATADLKAAKALIDEIS